MSRWHVSNGRYSITDGVVTLIVPYRGEDSVTKVLDHLNALYVGQRSTGRRICVACNQPIGNHHKWVFRADSRIEHRHCERPEDY